MIRRSRATIRRAGAVVFAACLTAGVPPAGAQDQEPGCAPFVLNGTVLECTAAGSMREQLTAGTFIAGSAAVGETLAQALGIEIATAPLGSSSGGFSFVFDRQTRLDLRTSPTYGPAFSERALTLGMGNVGGGVNYIQRRYDTLEGQDLDAVGVFQFDGGSLAVSQSVLALRVRTDTVTAFVQYGVLNNLDVGVVVPYVRVSVEGDSIILGQANETLQRVRLGSSHWGVGDVAIVGKYRFWQSGEAAVVPDERHAALALGATVRLPSGDSDELLGLGSGRVLVSVIGSGAIGRLSPHLNVGYEIWTDALRTPRDFQGAGTLSIKDQVQYSAGLEYQQADQLTLLFDVVGRYQRGGGRVGSQPYAFPPNRLDVRGADALVAVPGGYHSIVLAPGAKWNVYHRALLTATVLVAATESGLVDRATPVVGLDWTF